MHLSKLWCRAALPILLALIAVIALALPKQSDANGFDPSQIAGLQFWAKADSGVYTDAAKTHPATSTGNHVAVWADQSGNGLDAMQTSATTVEPVFDTTATSSLYFTGSSVLKANWATSTGNAARSIVVVFSTTNSANAQLISWGAGASNQLSQIAIYNGAIGYTGYGNDLTYPAAAYEDGKFHIVEVTFDGTTMNLYLDGVLEGTKTTTLNTPSSVLSIGNQINGGDPFAGNLAEIAVYNHALTSSDTNNMTTYFTSRWGSYTGSYTNNPASSAPADLTPPVPVIVDTDISGDIDDAGTLAEVNALAQQGQANLLAVVINSDNTYSAATAKVIDTWYGNGTTSIPIGAFQGNVGGITSSYTQQIVSQFDPLGTADVRTNFPTALSVYRQALASSTNNSVVIISVGLLNNLSDLLQSPADSISPLTGLQLISQKVRRLVVMGGIYPSSGTSAEYNFSGDPSATAYVMSNWPTEIVDEDFNVGNGIMTGISSSANSSTDPLKKIWDLGAGLETNGLRASWDETAGFYAIKGMSMYFNAAASGGQDVIDYSTGNNHFVPVGGNVAFLGTATSSSVIASAISALMNTYPAPSVAVTAPTSGITVSGRSVTLTAISSDYVGVTGVQFKVDGVAIGSIGTTSPYSVTWDSTSNSNGPHTIAAIATDAAGNFSTSSVTVTVSNATTSAAPVISSGGYGISSGGGGSYVATPNKPTLPMSAPCSLTDRFNILTGAVCPSAGHTSITSAVTSVPNATFNTNLQLGMTASQVKSLQQFLNANGFYVASSGAGSSGHETAYFGSATRAALIRFQRAKGITPPSGYFGPITRAYIAAHGGQ